MAYSLCWGGDSASLPPPPSLDAAVALAEALKNFRGQGCLLLEHQYTISSLARYGLGALKGNDRLQASALKCASSLMASDGGGGLELCVARATRVVTDHPNADPWSRERRPAVRPSDEAVFAEDGSAPSERTLARLAGLRLYRDVINKYGWKRGYRDYQWVDRLARDGGIFRGDRGEWEFISGMDAWFKSAQGGNVRFTGNEGHGETTEYFCYVLVIRRRDGEKAEEDDSDDEE